MNFWAWIQKSLMLEHFVKLGMGPEIYHAGWHWPRNVLCLSFIGAWTQNRIMLVLWAWAQKRIMLERLGMGPETYYA